MSLRSPPLSAFVPIGPPYTPIGPIIAFLLLKSLVKGKDSTRTYGINPRNLLVENWPGYELAAPGEMLHATGADDGGEEVAGDEEFGDVDLMLLELLLHPRRVLDEAVRDGDAVRHEYLSFAPYDVGGGEAQDVGIEGDFRGIGS
ncbi:MAG: hypothetical protein LQ341_000249 [Variospora aurantia]|nr:MAG: hypothetical protein LQ341_000249 [Variospora aurantia]